MARRHDRLSSEIGIFLQKYARPKHAGHDPNDRTYDRNVERVVKRMDPEELDALIRGDDLDEPIDSAER